MNFSEMLNIGLMQGFAGLSLFSVLLLMGLGLAIIFGQMGVINMAHGEFMTIGAYTVFLGSTLTEKFAPGFMNAYFPVAIVFAFIFAFIVGWITEWALIRHLYKRPLDTLLATWGLSLGMQQVFRSGIGPKEVSPTLPEWLMGSWAPHEGLDIPINGLFVLALTAFVTGAVMIALYRSRWGLRVRATVSNRVMANATGINTKQTDRLTFAIGCGIAGVAGAAFTTIGRWDSGGGDWKAVKHIQHPYVYPESGNPLMTLHKGDLWRYRIAGPVRSAQLLISAFQRNVPPESLLGLQGFKTPKSGRAPGPESGPPRIVTIQVRGARIEDGVRIWELEVEDPLAEKSREQRARYDVTMWDGETYVELGEKRTPLLFPIEGELHQKEALFPCRLAVLPDHRDCLCNGRPLDEKRALTGLARCMHHRLESHTGEALMALGLNLLTLGMARAGYRKDEHFYSGLLLMESGNVQ